MQETIIADTSCIIILDKISQLDLLQKIFGKVLITQEIAEEFGKSLPDFIHIKNPSEKNFNLLELAAIDKGEKSAIALALDQRNCLLIIDDQKGRKLADKFGIQTTGTIGVLIEAKKSGHIHKLKPLIEIIRKTNFRFSEDLLEKAIKISGE